MCGGSEANVFAATPATVRSGDRRVYHLLAWNLWNFEFCTTLPRGTRRGSNGEGRWQACRYLRSMFVCQILSCFDRRKYSACVDGEISRLESQS